MAPVQIFNKIYNKVKIDKFYVPEMTVDSWVGDGVIVQLFDGGSIIKISSNDVIVKKQYDYQNRCNYLIFKKGNEDDLKKLYNALYDN